LGKLASPFASKLPSVSDLASDASGGEGAGGDAVSAGSIISDSSEAGRQDGQLNADSLRPLAEELGRIVREAAWNDHNRRGWY